MKFAKKAARKVSTKVLRAKAKNLPAQQELEENKLELEKLKVDLAVLACTWTYKWDPLFVKKTPHIIVGGEIVWAGYVPPTIQCISNAICDDDGNLIYATNTTQTNLINSFHGKKRIA
jgi:hypothetical protein